MTGISLRSVFCFTVIAALLCGAGLNESPWCMALLNTVIPLLFGYAFLTEVWLRQGSLFWQGFLAFSVAYWLIRPAGFDATGDVFHHAYNRLIKSPGRDLPAEIKRLGFLHDTIQTAGLLAVASTGGLLAIWLKRDKAAASSKWSWVVVLLPAALIVVFVMLLRTMDGRATQSPNVNATTPSAGGGVLTESDPFAPSTGNSAGGLDGSEIAPTGERSP